ncbi:AraC-like ligand binding domain-containing protein [Butyrivibrio proteoclasticus]|uniref:AraC-like ligand binding domain-containing protein n=1 Tax=Butyrivibrio proteoclasticus TaxID=43305 RepID=A0A1I5R316_9FIRM|nr:AraC family transcriptional regulator [Butyrivibrio proteoclasticus]SFP52446.1 AraC-like ligand binding domain-containing protein [Butyrivibrio proteoclasticus]
MNKKILEILNPITDEEKAILDGAEHINRNLYYSDEKSSTPDDEIDSSRVLQDGKLIDMRPHVRFIHFPLHTHNYVEFIYMCQGETTHIIDGQRIVLKEGDLLFMNQHARQEILPAGENDIAVNFMILPEFFDTAFSMLEKNESPLRDFLVSCLTKKNADGNFLYFKVSDIPQIQNIMENMIWNMIGTDSTDYQNVNQVTIGLLFLNLLKHTESIGVSRTSYDQEIMFKLLRYIDTDYRDASLTSFSNSVSEDPYVLSRIIKKNTGSTFKELLQSKRLNKAQELLKNTNISIADISVMVGYDNTSFFHRLFRRNFGCSPRDFRLNS